MLDGEMMMTAAVLDSEVLDGVAAAPSLSAVKVPCDALQAKNAPHSTGSP